MRRLCFTVILTISFMSSSKDLTPIDIYKLQFQHETLEIYTHYVKDPSSFSLHHDDAHKNAVLKNVYSKSSTKSIQRKLLIDDQENKKIKTVSSGVTDCHMAALALYPKHLQNVAYGAVSNGDDIEHARVKFVNAIRKEQERSNELRTALDKIEVQFLDKAAICVSKALEGTPLRSHHQQ